MATTSAATSADPGGGSAAPVEARSVPVSSPPELVAQVDAAKKALAGGVSTEAAGLLVEGFNNIGFGGERIVDLSGPSACTATGTDKDYSVQNLGNNKNDLSSMRVRNSSCVIVLFDGPGFTGENWVVFSSCDNLGSCGNRNIWKRANSFYLT